MSLAEEIRARRGDADDPFDQVAARREFKRARRSGAPAVTEISEGQADAETRADDAARDRRRRSAAQARRAGGFAKRTAGHTMQVATGARRPINVAGEGAGVLLGVIGYALVLNYVRGGAPAVTGWIKAKFLNVPYTGKTVGPTSPAATKPGTATPPAYAPNTLGPRDTPTEHSPAPAPPYTPTQPGAGDFTQTPPLPRGA